MSKAPFRVFVIIATILPLLIIMITWTPEPVVYEEMPPLRRVDNVLKRKRAFIKYMKPIIQTENDRILEQRSQLLSAYWEYWNNGRIGKRHLDEVMQLFEDYGVETGEKPTHEIWTELFRRVDVVPLKLALAQSAAESAWGTSRLARLGNSFFGQWTFHKMKGIKPIRRPPGEKHRVARFVSVQDATRAYMHNLNTHWAYETFRQLRYRQRLMGKEPDGLTLAKGLQFYSARRHRYVKEIRTIIIKNRELMETL